MNVSRVEKYKKHKKNKPPKRRLLPRILGLIISIGLGLTVIAGVVTLMLFSANLPPLDLASISNYSQTAVILDKNGAEISRVSGVENRIKTNLSDLPDYLIKAVLAVEDTRFYQHHGIDFKRIAGALWVDIKTLSFSEGASTITQQVVKNSQLTQEKKVSRKITEALLALQLERLYDKDEILEAYLNIIPYGEGVYGIETASELYFGKSASDLNLAESALLAGIPKSPTYYSPYDYPEAAKERRNLILRLMNDAGYISETEMRAAQAAPLEVTTQKAKGFPHGYFVDYVLDRCMEYLGMTRSELIESGYTIETTMDQTVQNKLEELFSQTEWFPTSPASGEACQSAVLVMDPQTGNILGMMGGRNEGDYQLRSFNRCTGAYRQPGSTIKPLAVYGPALEWYGYTTATPVLDEPVEYAGYRPSNYSGTYRGQVTVRDALADSINIPAVRIYHDIGPGNGADFLETVGIHLAQEDQNSLSVALGGVSQGVSPLQLAEAYTVFPGKGAYRTSDCVLSVKDTDGKVLWEKVPAYKNTLSEETAFLINDMLTSTTEEGTASVLRDLPFPVAAKTGTVQLPKSETFTGISGLNDSWMVAYTPRYLVTVWMGFDRTTPDTYLPANATGGSYPAMLAKEILATAEKDQAPEQFQKPLDVVQIPLDKTGTAQGKIWIASTDTPPEDILNEYFASNNIPTETAPPRYYLPDDVRLTILANGFPCIEFTAKAGGRYRLYRQERNTETETVAVLSGDENNHVRFVDFSAVPGTEYGYSVNIQDKTGPVLWTGDVPNPQYTVTPTPTPITTPSPTPTSKISVVP